MGILDALRVQKAGQRSVQELSQLPQQEIIKMAQMGQIPADVVPVIISEKARMAQQVAQAQAMQQQRPPTVMEQAMQLNAQEEQKGLPAIPTQGMFQPQNFQRGGIVGYAGDGEEGQLVETQPIITSKFVTNEPSTKGPNFEQSVLQAERALAKSNIQAQEEKDYAELLRKPDMDKNQLLWMSLLRGGLKGLAGGSQHAGTAIGEGLSEAAKSYDEGLKDMRKNQLAYAKERADIAKAKRQEGTAAVTLGAKLYESDAALQAALEKAIASGNMNAYVRFQVEAARERGDTRSDKAIAAASAKEYAEIVAALDARRAQAAASGTSAAAATKQAIVAETKVGKDETAKDAELRRKTEEDKAQRETAARKEVNDRLRKPSIAIRQRIREVGEDRVYNELLQRELGKPAPPPPPSGFQPKGSGQLPPGFQLVR